MAARAWLIDASIYIFRAWFSLPERWHSPQGYPLNAVVGYAGFLHQFIADHAEGPHLAAAFDESLGSCFRNDIYPGYKASRALPDEALAFQLAACRRLTELAGVPCYGGERYEADDYIATLARLAREQGLPVTVVTRDKDLGQLLLGTGDHWWDFAADNRLDAAAFEQRFGVRPAQFADYLALVGDSIDDIPGVPGVGPKSAAGLLQARDDLDAIAADFEGLASLPLRGAARLAERLREHWPQVQVARALAALEAAVPGIDTLPYFAPSAGHYAAVAAYLAELGLAGAPLRRWQQLADSLERHP